jgi:hypothetical protein
MTQSEMKAAAGFCSDFVEEARLKPGILRPGGE